MPGEVLGVGNLRASCICPYEYQTAPVVNTRTRWLKNGKLNPRNGRPLREVGRVHDLQ